MSPPKFNADTATLLVGETMIEANAGTGKTYTLCRIVERLILEKKIPIERILAVTFTNAAAYELKERIRKNLREKKKSLAKHEKDSRNLLSRALANFDNARIFTLHAFCKCLLSEFSFECGVHPNSDLIVNEEHLIEQVTLDFRRFYFLDSTPFCSALAYTGNLRTENLIKAFNTKESDTKNNETLSQKEFDEMEYNAHLKYKTLVNTWKAQFSEIKDFLFNKGAQNGAKPKNNFFEFKQRFASAIEQIESPSPDYGLIHLIRINLKEEIKPKNGQNCPSFFGVAQTFCEDCQKIEDFIIERFLTYGKSQLSKLKDKLNLRTFDDLQQLVALGLGGERGSSLIEKVFSQYDAALVDEFQDTDPLQFEILRKLFTKSSSEEKKHIFYIGDPKQSIYKFRGADLNNYLKIRGNLEKDNICSLTTNYRTHPLLVEATNQFLTLHSANKHEQANDNLFMDERIIFEKSEGHTERDEEKLLVREERDLAPAPFNIRFSPKLTKNETQKEVEAGILNDITHEILSLLDPDKITNIGGRPIRGSDIAVLCRTNPEVDAVYAKLNEFAIPCVLQASRSIFHSDEAKHFKFLMEALLSPNDASKIRKVLVLPLFSFTAIELENFEVNPANWDFWADRFSAWSKLWAKHGLSYALQTLLRDDFRNINDLKNKLYQPIQQRILSQSNGERRMTNYLHLSELLYQAEQTVSSNFPRNLYLWYIEQIQMNTDIDEADARLESDDDAIKILTIHKSKGLEFPITFIPFSWKVPFKKAKDLETQQEGMRLLYVALTRASSRMYFYIREPNKNFAFSSIARCISENISNALETLEKRPDLFSVENCKVGKPERTYQRTLSESSYRSLEFLGTIPSGYLTSSFSQKIKGQNKDKDLDESENFSHSLVIPFDQRKKAHAFPAGTKAGNFFHEVFENIDFQENDHSATIDFQLRKHGLRNADPKIAHGLVLSALDTPLNKHNGAVLKLSEILKENLMVELEFHVHAPDFSFHELGQHLSLVAPNNLFSSYLLGKADESIVQTNQCFFKGFIDLTFRHNQKYYILDWKSNLLTGEQGAFASKSLPSTMAHSDYILQYHLYTLALHRFLKQTMPNSYNYTQNFGGNYYLFLRGMYEPSLPDDGIFFDCPPESMIESMDQFFSVERAQSHA